MSDPEREAPLRMLPTLEATLRERDRRDETK